MPGAIKRELLEMIPEIPESRHGFDIKDWVSAWPSLGILYDTPQDKEHHAEGNVGVHTEMVVDSLLGSSHYSVASQESKKRLFLAALLHDIGKPLCTREENGRITSKGHSAVGAVDARILMWRAGIDFFDREKICHMIANHQNPFFAIRMDDGDYRIRKMSWALNVDELSILADADNNGRISSGALETRDSIELFRVMAEEMNCLDKPYAFQDNHSRVSYFRSGGKQWADTRVHVEPGSKVTVLCGLPASGKDTWVKANASGIRVLSLDDAREELGIVHGDKDAGRAVHQVFDQARELLRRKEPFVWNSTNISPLIRKKTLDLLHDYHAETTCVYLEVPESVLRERNRHRVTTVTNTAIDRMLLKWDIPTAIETHQLKHEIGEKNSLNWSKTVAL